MRVTRPASISKTVGLGSAVFLVALTTSAMVFASKARTPGATPNEESARADRARAWREFLGKTTSGVGSVMLEAGRDESPPPIVTGKPDLVRLALVLGRDFQRVGDTTVLVRPATGAGAAGRSAERLVDWLSRIPAAQRAALFDRGLPADQIDPGMIPALGLLVGDAEGKVGQQMATGPFLVKLSFAISADYGDPKKGPSHGTLSLEPRSPVMIARPTDPAMTAIPPTIPSIGTHLGPDRIDAPQGRFEEMAPMLREVAGPLRTRLVVDERLGKEWLFVRGSIGAKDFTESMARLTSIEPAHPLSDHALAKAALDRVLTGALRQELDAAEQSHEGLKALRDRPSLTGDEIAQAIPETQSSLERLGLTSGTRANVGIGICVSISIPPCLAFEYGGTFVSKAVP